MRLSSRFLMGAVILAVLLTSRPLPRATAQTSTYIVTSLADDTVDDGQCTLREAILAANNTPAIGNCGPGSSGDDTIIFNPALSGSIVLSATLPTL